MKDRIKKDEAVSPVVGVMLMLVVTIIIAAVVSAFAGGLAGDNQKAPQASIVATDFVARGIVDTVETSGMTNAWGQGQWRPDQGDTGPAADIYVVFEHMGGDSLNLDTIEIHLGKLSEPQMGSLVSRALTPQAGPDLVTSQGNFGTIGVKADIPGWSKGWTKYLEKYPNRTSVVIKPGDRFVLHADYGARNAGGENRVMWLQQSGDYPFPIGKGDVLTYDIIDKNSKKIICSGQIAVPDFGVASS
ncbi:MAG: type IV pilin N-terminal domain-containing protein [Methanoregulaceae archaeon]